MKKNNKIQLELGGKVYPTVELNNQLWMAENLNLELDEGCWVYEENSLYGEWFGRLYTWDAAMQACPDGWHLPSNEEWEAMIQFFGGEKEAYHKLLESGEKSFNARFAGYRSHDGIFLSIERAADFWTSTEAGKANAWLRYLLYKKERIFKLIDDKRCGFSVRYVKD